ncbi:MAG: Holliday junction branch migration protein RuvA [Fimbriimonadia bacterium]|jgi:Holliday junction DNA helicase RuvA
MITRLRGTVLERSKGRLVVDVNGVGYEVAVSDSVERVAPESVDLFIRLVCHDGEWDLYGFLGPVERDVFDLLRSVSGVGPRTALGLIGSMGAGELAKAVAHREAKALTTAPGVGPKLAQRIVLELADKMGEMALLDRAVSQVSVSSQIDDVEAALVALGYPKAEARRAALSAADGGSHHASVEDLVRKALSLVARR